MILTGCKVLETSLDLTDKTTQSFIFKIQLVKPNSHTLNTLKSLRKESNNEKQTKDNNNQLDSHTNHHNIRGNNQKHFIR